MVDHEQTARELARSLVTHPYTVSAGNYRDISIEAILTDEDFVLQHNLGGFHVPSKSDAAAVLGIMEEYFRLLVSSSEELSRLAGSRELRLELCVFSGQMDFSVAVKRGGEITWLVNLDRD